MWARARTLRATLRATAVALAAALALGGCGKPAAVHRPGDEYLKTIDVRGNRQVKERSLTSGLALKRAQRHGRPPDPYLVQLDEDRIRGEYLRRGFFGIDVRARVERAGDAATVVYTVEEGRRAATRVAITGIPHDPDLPISKVRAQLPIADGAPFDYAVYDEAKPKLLGVVQDAGYAHARLESTVYADRANQVAVVQLDYTVGPKCTFGPVEISGVSGDLAAAVRARVQFSQGDRYSTQAIAATQRQLYGMARFSTVQVQPDEGESPVVTVKIAVSEAARREIRLGGGFGIDPTAYEVRARTGYTIAGWPFPLDTATIDLRPAYAYMRDGSGLQPRIRALARLERQDLFWTYARGELEAGYSYIAIEPYTSYGPRARVGFLTPVFSSRVQAGVGWSLEELQFRSLSPLIDEALAADLHLDAPQRVGEYTQTVTVDLRDHPVEPRLGAYAALRSAIGTRAAGGAFEFVQLVPDLRGYVPLGPVVLGARLRAGAFFGEVPATERFFSGGASNHRGFGERQLAPSVMGEVNGRQRTVPYGGGALVETGVEGRFPITTWRKIGIGGAVFLDGGDVREELADIAPGELLWAAGVGLRLKTLVGPIRADFGYRLNHRPAPDDPAPGTNFAFHLSLGEAF
jgi:outer membrane protein assembly factor BamA